MARVKSSKARKILSALKEEYELLEDTIEEMWPDKKTPVIIAECRNKMQLIVRDGLPIFYKPRDGRWVPSLRFLYKYPGIIKAVRVDKGAIRFVLRGAVRLRWAQGAHVGAAGGARPRRSCCHLRGGQRPANGCRIDDNVDRGSFGGEEGVCD